MKLGSDWKNVFEHLNERGCLTIEVDGLPVVLYLYFDGEIIRFSKPIGVQRVPQQKTALLFEEEAGRAWLRYDEFGGVSLHYEGRYDSLNFEHFRKRALWFLRVSHWAKECQLGEETASF